MYKDFQRTELYFVLDFTYCKLEIYRKEEAFAKRILQQAGVEFLEKTDRKDWEEIDTSVLLHLVVDALPKLIEAAMPKSKVIAEKMIL